MDYWLFFTSDWSLASSVNNTKGDFHYKVDNILVKKHVLLRGDEMGDVLFASLRGVEWVHGLFFFPLF